MNERRLSESRTTDFSSEEKGLQGTCGKSRSGKDMGETRKDTQMERFPLRGGERYYSPLEIVYNFKYLLFGYYSETMSF